MDSLDRNKKTHPPGRFSTPLQLSRPPPVRSKSSHGKIFAISPKNQHQNFRRGAISSSMIGEDLDKLKKKHKTRISTPYSCSYSYPYPSPTLSYSSPLPPRATRDSFFLLTYTSKIGTYKFETLDPWKHYSYNIRNYIIIICFIIYLALNIFIVCILQFACKFKSILELRN